MFKEDKERNELMRRQEEDHVEQEDTNKISRRTRKILETNDQEIRVNYFKYLGVRADSVRNPRTIKGDGFTGMFSSIV